MYIVCYVLYGYSACSGETIKCLNSTLKGKGTEFLLQTQIFRVSISLQPDDVTL